MNICFYRSTNTDDARTAVLWLISFFAVKTKQNSSRNFRHVSMHNGLEFGNADSQSVRFPSFLEQFFFIWNLGLSVRLEKGYCEQTSD